MWKLPPCAIAKKVENRTITKTSSREAPARIICGTPFSVPYLFSIRFTILGTTTAGETALKTAPITAASIRVTGKKTGAKIRYAMISNVAGRKDIKSAGRPTFFRSFKFRESPALMRIMTSAIFRSSAEMPRMEGSKRSRTYGPSRIPVTSIPMMRGRWIF